MSLATQNYGSTFFKNYHIFYHDVQLSGKTLLSNVKVTELT